MYNQGCLLSTCDLTWHFYYYLISFVPHGMYGTPRIKLLTESSLQHTLRLETRAEFELKNYCVPTEDVKLLRRNLRACLQEVTSSFRLFKLARSALQMMKYFSHRHKLQRFEAGLNGAACFKIFQVKLNPILASFKCQIFLLSSVYWVSCLGLWKKTCGSSIWT